MRPYRRSPARRVRRIASLTLGRAVSAAGTRIAKSSDGSIAWRAAARDIHKFAHKNCGKLPRRKCVVEDCRRGLAAGRFGGGRRP
ncbi:hypothetical protein BURPS1655_L0121 [Burkholderia pseudomallei 1655]|nr:hypothetical protein BURPS1655_L0121 [Burkholderia pseudomallei 1655]